MFPRCSLKRERQRSRFANPRQCGYIDGERGKSCGSKPHIVIVWRRLIASHIRNDMPVFIKRAGHCTRCGSPLGKALYMVREHVTWRVTQPDGLTREEIVAVCTACATPAEKAAAKAAAIAPPPVCAGCGRQMHVAARGRRGRYLSPDVCSSPCGGRARRRADRYKQRVCEVCRTEFTSALKRARYCSGACRQAAYRLRVQSLSSAPTKRL